MEDNIDIMDISVYQSDFTTMSILIPQSVKLIQQPEINSTKRG